MHGGRAGGSTSSPSRLLLLHGKRGGVGEAPLAVRRRPVLPREQGGADDAVCAESDHGHHRQDAGHREEHVIPQAYAKDPAVVELLELSPQVLRIFAEQLQVLS